MVEFGHMQRWLIPLYNDSFACISRVSSRAHITGVCSLLLAMGLIRQFTHDGVIAPLWVRTTEMPADFLTKCLPREAFERCMVQSGMTPHRGTFRHSCALAAARRGVL